MRVVFFAADKPRERDLGEAFIKGVTACGDAGLVVVKDSGCTIADGDVACMVGVKSRDLFYANKGTGRRVVMLDKGYKRQKAPGSKVWEYWRTAVDAHHPTEYIARAKHDIRRFQGLSLGTRPWRRTGRHIVLAGSSAKYHAFYGLPDATDYAAGVIAELRKYTDRRIVYRPKPSWRGAVPIKGAGYSSNEDKLSSALAGAWALVTHGSNACFEAALWGIPSIILGNAVTRPISSTSLADIEAPRLAPKAERNQCFANIAYCQWTMEEFASGEAWRVLRKQIAG